MLNVSEKAHFTRNPLRLVRDIALHRRQDCLGKRVKAVIRLCDTFQTPSSDWRVDSNERAILPILSQAIQQQVILHGEFIGGATFSLLIPIVHQELIPFLYNYPVVAAGGSRREVGKMFLLKRSEFPSVPRQANPRRMNPRTSLFRES